LVGLVTGIVYFFLNTLGQEMVLRAYPVQIFGVSISILAFIKS